MNQSQASTGRIFFSFFIFISFFVAINGDKFTFNDSQSLLKCINGDRPSNSEMYITTTEMIRKLGYPAEEHVVLTEDGYLLTMHRIPGAAGSSPVFLQHGLLSSSFDWVVAGAGKGLAFILANQGYDVWLGNARGCTYSRCHAKYSTSEYRYWNFSWHEMGIYDLPAAITYVTSITNQKIIYVGHSMGTTMFYVMAIERPDIAAKVKAMFSLAPVAYFYFFNSSLRLIAPFVHELEMFTRVTGIANPFSQNPFIKLFFKYGCNAFWIQRKICTNFIFYTLGFDPPQFNYTLLPMILYHAPAGTSMKTYTHYLQEINTGKFQYYDYGVKDNLKLYNSAKPPDYNISKIQVPIGIIWSDNDFIANPKDIQIFYNKLPKRILNYRVEYTKFNHVDYLWGINAFKYVYSKLVSVMENYR